MNLIMRLVYFLNHCCKLRIVLQIRSRIIYPFSQSTGIRIQASFKFTARRNRITQLLQPLIMRCYHLLRFILLILESRSLSIVRGNQFKKQTGERHKNNHHPCQKKISF